MSDPDPVARAMSSEDELVPSSGFTSAVMEAIRIADTPRPPLPFPWARFVPGVAACLIAALTAAVLSPLETSVVPSDFTSVVEPLSKVAPDLAYAAAAIVLALLTVYGRTLFRVR